MNPAQIPSALRELILKDLRTLLRAKASALVVILGPLLLILLAGIAFDNTNTYAVNVGVYSQQYNSVSDQLIDRLNEQFSVTRFLSEDDCAEAIKRGTVHACAVFAPDFKIAINGSNTIDFYVDYSRLNLVTTIMEAITRRVSSKSLELSRNLTAILVNALEQAKSEARKSRPIIVALTTENENINQKLTAIFADNSELEIKDVSAADIGLDEFEGKKNRVKQWIDAQNQISGQTLTEARKFVLQAYGLAKDAVGDEMKAMYDSAMATIDQLSGRLNATGTLVQNDFNELNALTNKVTTQLGIIIAQTHSAAENKKMTIDNVASARQSLETALLKILDLQRSLNTIENAIAGIEIFDPDAISQPIITKVNPVSTEQSYLNYIFPLLIALVIMFTALLLGPTLVLLERASPAHTRHLLAPIPDWLRVLATFLSTMSVLGVQVLIVLVIAAAFFSWQVLYGLHVTLIALIGLMALFSLLGMAIGYAFQSETTAMLASTALGTVLLLFSNVLVPIERLPRYLMYLAQYNPFVIGGDLVRKAIIHHEGLTSLYAPLGILLLMSAAAAAFALFVFSESRTQHFTRAAKAFLTKKK